MIDTNNFILLSFVFMRMSGFIIFNPILGRRNVPPIVKSGFIMVLTFIVYTVAGKVDIAINTPIEYGFILVIEFILGYVFGFIVNLFQYIIIFGGEIIDFEMGISMSKIYDPQSNASLSLSATLYNIVFMFIFFISDSHLTLINIMMSSQSVVQYGTAAIGPNITSVIIEVFCQCTILAVKLSMPFVVIEFLANMGMGILMKTIPQINVFVISMQVKLFIGLIFMILLFSPIAWFLENCILLMFEALEKILFIMR